MDGIDALQGGAGICSSMATCMRCSSPRATPRSTSSPASRPGADDYLVKPVHEPELIARLNTGRRILALEHSLRSANERNRILSITDALTGAFNRRYIMDQLPRELERCRRYGDPLSVIMCDVDHFKQVNDVKGHAAGDDVLQQFAARMQRSIRATSDWVARLGGRGVPDRAPGNGLQGADARGRENPRHHDARPLRDPRGRCEVTASFGVASTELHGPDCAEGPRRLIRTADECLYRSKQSGRNRATGGRDSRAGACAIRARLRPPCSPLNRPCAAAR